LVGTGAAAVDVVEAFPLTVDAEPVRNVTVLAEDEEDVVVALPTMAPVPVKPVVASVMVDDKVRYVPVAVAALGAFVPVRMVRAGSFVEIEGTDWPWTVSILLRETSATNAPNRFRDPITV